MDICVDEQEQAKVYKGEHQDVVLAYNEDDNEIATGKLDSPMKSSLNQSMLTDNDKSVSNKFA